MAMGLISRRGLAVLAGVFSLGAAPPGPVGQWHGTYTCAQGLTMLDLSIAAPDATHLRGEFHFSADDSNPNVPEGCFSMKGGYDPDRRAVRLMPGAWRLRPFGYVMVGLEGRMDATGQHLSGDVTHADGCTIFTLERDALEPEPDDVCSKPHSVARLGG